jgi:hypothetical protein
MKSGDAIGTLTDAIQAIRATSPDSPRRVFAKGKDHRSPTVLLIQKIKMYNIHSIIEVQSFVSADPKEIRRIKENIIDTIVRKTCLYV